MPTITASDQPVAEGAEVILSGTISRGASDTTSILTYAWRQITSETDTAAPSDPFTLTGASGSVASDGSATVTFTAPSVDANTDYYFQLTATATEGAMTATATDVVTVTVQNAALPPVVSIDNTIPDASEPNIHRRAEEPGATVTIGGNIAPPNPPAPGSSTLAYTLSQVVSATDLTTVTSGGANYVTLTGDTSDSVRVSGSNGLSIRDVTFTAPSGVATYYFLIRASYSPENLVSGAAGIANHIVAIAVEPAPAPMVDAGTDQTGRFGVDEGGTINLVGTVNRAVGDTASTLTYAWVQVNGSDATADGFATITSGSRHSTGYLGAITLAVSDGTVALTEAAANQAYASLTNALTIDGTADTTYYFQLIGTASLAGRRTATSANDIVAVQVRLLDDRTLVLERLDGAFGPGVSPITDTTIAETDANVELYYFIGLATDSGVAFSDDTDVTWSIRHGSLTSPDAPATSDADFVGDTTGSITFMSGADSNTAGDGITITIAGDNLAEDDEQFTVVLSVPDETADGGTNIDAISTITITDDDVATARTLTLTRYTDSSRGTETTATSVAEADADMDLYYSIGTGGTAFSSETVVTWSITHGSPATVNDDFTATSGTVTFAANSTDAEDFTVAIAGDNINEANEMFTVGLSVAGGDTDASATSAITITDDDPIAAAITATTNVTEGGNATVNVALGAIPSTAVTVAYTIGATSATTDVDAVAADYTDTSGGSIDIAASTDPPTGAITIGIGADNLNESAETFTVTIAATGITGAVGTPTVASGGEQTFTIAASDPVTASIAAPTPATVNEGQSATFTVTLTGASAGLAEDITIGYTVGGDTTDTPTDAGSGSLTIAAGTTLTGNIPIGIPTNASLDADSSTETLTVTLDSVSGGAGGSVAASPGNAASVTVSYLATAAAHSFAFTNPAMSINESLAATYTVTRTSTAIIGTNIVVSWTYAAGSASATDFMGDTAPAGGALTYTGSETSKTFTVTTKGDALNEAGETFTLGLDATATVLASEGGVTLGNAVTVTITDDDPIQVTITRASGTAASVGEAGTASFDVSLGLSRRTTDVVVPFTFSGLDNAEFNITAPTGIAASALGGTVTFVGASTSSIATETITVNLLDDSVDEASETLTVTGAAAGPTGLRTAGTIAYTSGGNMATVTVTDDDDAPSGAVPMPTVEAGDDQTVGEGTLVTLGGAVTPAASDTTSTLSYAWVQITSATDTMAVTTGPNHVGALSDANGAVARTGDNANQAIATFTAPAVSATTTYYFQLTGTAAVSGMTDGSATDIVAIAVQDAAPAPTASAGTDQTGASAVDEGVTVTLSGSVARAGGDSISTLGYAWAQVTADDGVTEVTANPITLTGATGTGGTASATFTAPDILDDTTFYFRLTGTASQSDKADGTARDVVAVAVNNIRFTAPTVSVGAARTGASAENERTSVRLRGEVMRGSPVGARSGLGYTWVQVTDASGVMELTTDPINLSGATGIPGAGGLSTADFTAPEVTADTTFYFRLTGTERSLNPASTIAPGIASAVVALEVKNVVVVPPPPPPVVTVGRNQTVNEGATLTVTGTVTAAVGDTVTTDIGYTWFQVTSTGEALGRFSTERLTITDTLSGTAPSDGAVSFTFAAPEVSADTTYYFRLEGTAQRPGPLISRTVGDRLLTVTVLDAAAPVPTVNAGADQTGATAVNERTASVTLNGTVTRASGDTASTLSYAWVQITSATDTTAATTAGTLSNASGSVPVTGANIGQARATFTAPSVASDTTYYFQLTGTSSQASMNDGFDSDIVAVEVANTDAAPTVTANDQAVDEGVTVTLSGSVVRAAADTTSVLSYAWVQVTDARGATAVTASPLTLTGASGTPGAGGASSATFTAPSVDSNTDYYFRLTGTATDGTMIASATAVATITVRDMAAVPAVPAPAVEAGAAQTVSEGAPVTLGGTVTPAAGDSTSTLSYEWQQVTSEADRRGVASPIALSNGSGAVARTGDTANQAIATFTAPAVSAAATYYFQLTGTAAEGGMTDGSATDVVAITVQNVVPAPTVSAGTDQTGASAVDEGDTVTLSGSVARAGGDTDSTLAYAWLQVNGSDAAAPGFATIASGDEGYAGAITLAVPSGIVALMGDAANQANASLTAPDVTADTSYYFQLTGTASQAGSDDVTASDIVTVEVKYVADRTLVLTRTTTAGGGIPAVATSVNETDADLDLYYFIGLAAGSAAFVSDTVVTWTITHGTPATSAADFAAVTGSVTFTTGQTVSSAANDIVITIIGDDLDEDDEQFTVGLSVNDETANGGINTDATSTITIVDDDDAASRTLTLTRYTDSGRGSATATTATGVTEADAALVLYYRIGIESGGMDFASSTAVMWAISHGSPATVAADFSGNTSGTVMMTNQGDFAITIAGDNLNEANEMFSVGLSVAGGDTDASATSDITITDDDTVNVAITRAAGTAASVGEAATASFTVTLSGGARTADVVVPFTVGGLDNAEFNITTPSGIDASALGGAVTFTGGTTNLTETITVNLLDDSVDEANETLTVTGAAAGPTGLRTAGAIAYTSGGNMATVTVTDDDDAPVTTVPAPTVMAGTDQMLNEGTMVTLRGTVTRAATDATSTLAYAWVQVTDNTGTMVLTPSTISLTNASGTVAVTGPTLGQAHATFTAPEVSADTPYYFRLTGTATQGTMTANATSVVTVTVRDMPSGPVQASEFTIMRSGSGAVNEGGMVSFSVTRDVHLSSTATVQFSVGGRSIDASDYDITAPSGIAAGATGGTVSFGATSTSETITISVTDDALNEALETLTVTGGTIAVTGMPAGAAAYATGGDMASADINASDPITYSIADASNTAEPAAGATETMNFIITLSAASAGSVSVPLRITGGTATHDSDYRLFRAGLDLVSITISAGQTMRNAGITILPDDVNEPDETIVFTIGAHTDPEFRTSTLVGAVTLSTAEGAATATGTISANDAAEISLAPFVPASVNEGGSISFGVSMASGATALTSAGDVCVTFTTAITTQQNPVGMANTASNAATPNPDIRVTGCNGAPVVVAANGGATGGVTIPAGASSAMATINILPDGIDEGSTAEQLTVTLTSVTGISGASLSIHSTNNSDDINISNVNFDRMLTVTRTSGTGDVAEGASVGFTMTLTGDPFDSATTVTWNVANGGAEDGDFVTGNRTGTVSFATSDADGTTKTFTVATSDDTINEGAETFTVNADAPNALTSVGIAASITIGASDPITYSITTADTSRAEGAGGTASFTVTLAGASGGSEFDSIMIPFSVDEDASSATAADYRLSSSPLTFTGTDFSEDITVTIVNDRLGETDETVVLQLGATAGTSGAGGGAVNAGSDTSATLTINDDDGDIVVSIARVDGEEIAENGGMATFRVTTSATPAAALTVPYTIGGTGITAADISATSLSGMLTIAAADSDGDIITVTAAADALLEGDEEFTVTLGASGYSGGNGGTNTRHPTNNNASAEITDANRATATLSGGGNVDEGGNAVITVTLSGDTRAVDVVVPYSLRGGTGVTSDDYTDPNREGSTTRGSITIPPANPSGTLTISIEDDTNNEMAEVLTLTAPRSGTPATPGNVTIAGSPLTITINPSDPQEITIARDPGEGTGAVDEGGQVSFLFTRATHSNMEVDVAYTIAGTGIDASDYDISGLAASATGGTVSFGMTSTSETLMISVTDDAANEALETLTVTGGAITAPAGFFVAYADDGGAASVDISASDPITVTLADATDINEGGTATFAVTLTDGAGTARASATDTTVNYSVAAAAGTPVTPFTDLGGGSIMIAAGDTGGNIEIRADGTGDINSGMRTITVTLGTISGVGFLATPPTSGSPQSVAVSYRAFARNFSVTGGDGTVAESAGTHSFTVALSAVPSANATVEWAISGDVESGDYSTAANNPLMFTPVNWNTAQTVAVTIINDSLNEAAEALVFTLSNAQGGGGLGTGITTASATATITDDDTINVAITRAAGTAASVGEAATASFTVTLSGGARTADVVVPFTVGGLDNAEFNITVPSGIDASALGGAVTFTGGTTNLTETITVNLLDDSVDEASETLTVTGAAAGPTGLRTAGVIAYTSGGNMATVTVTDDDDAPIGAVPAPTVMAGTDQMLNEGTMVTLRGTVRRAATDATSTLAYAWVQVTDNTGTVMTAPADRISLSNASGTVLVSGPTLGQAHATFTAPEVSADTPYYFRLTGTATQGTMTANATSVVTVTVRNVAAAARTLTLTRYSDSARTTADTTTSVTEADTALMLYYRIGIESGGMDFASSTAVTWTITHGSPATVNDDFTATSGTVMMTNQGDFAIAVAGDNLNEANEMFSVGLSVAASVTDTNASSATSAITIADDDDISVAIARAAGTAASVGEAATASFDVNLTGGTSTAAVMVPFTVSGLDATEFDITAPGSIAATATGATLAIAAGSSSGTITVNLIDDMLNEAGETLTVTGGVLGTAGAIAYATNGDEATVTVTDDDAISVSIAVTSPDRDPVATNHQSEEGRNAVFTVTLSAVSSGAVTVPYSIGGAVDAADYTAPASPLSIAANTNTGTITISLADDADTDPEDLTVMLDASGYTAAGTIARSTTTDEQSATTSVVTRTAARSLTLTRYTTAGRTTAATGTSVAEADTALTLYYRIGIGSGDTAFTNPAAVMWTITHGSPATAAADFSGNTSGTVMMTNQGDFTIVIAGDNLNEEDEMFTVGLSVADDTLDGGTATDANETLTIMDDDVIAAVITATTAVTEGGNATVSVDLGAVPTTAVMVAYAIGATTATTDVDAVASDYTDTSGGSIAIAANTDPPSGAISIALAADNLNESAETFTVTVAASGITGAIGTPTVASGGVQIFTIAASNPITAAIAAPTPATVNEGQSATFPVTLTGASAGSAADITVPYTVSAVAGVSGGSITIAAGATEGDIVLAIPFNTDRDDGETDTLTVTLGALSAAAGGGSVSVSGSGRSATATVNYLSAAHSLVFASPATSIAEGAAATTYTVTRNGPDLGSGTLAVTWGYTAGDTAAADFMGGAPAGGALNFTGASGTAQTFTVTTAADTLNEGDETFSLSLSVAPADATAAGGVAVPAPLSVTITDDSADAISVTIAAGAASVAEGGNATFSVTLGGGVRTADVVVPFTVSGLDAAEYSITTPAGIAAAATGGMVTFGIGGTPMATDSQNIVINLSDDNVNEASGALTVTGTAAGPAGLRTAGTIAYAVGGASDMVTVNDDDAITVSIAADAPTVSEGATAAFTVTLSNASAGVVTVPYTARGTTDTPSDANGGSITIAAGQTSGAIRLGIPSNATLNDGDSEMLTVSLGAATVAAPGGGTVTSTGMATVTVNYRTAVRTLTVTGAANHAETDANTAIVYTVALAGTAFSNPTVVTWTISHGGTEAADFAAVTGTITFPAQRTFTVTVIGDNRNEADESFSVQVSVANPAADDGTASGPAAMTTISDDDAIAIAIVGPARVNEGRPGAPATYAYRVDLGAQAMTQTTVAITAGIGSTAMTPLDYSIAGAPVIVPANEQRSGAFTVTVTDGGGTGTDDRTLVLTATTPDGMSGMLAVTISEDDPQAREVRMEQADTTLSRAVAALSVPVIVRRLDPGRGLASSGVSLNLGGRRVLSPTGSGAVAPGVDLPPAELMDIPREFSPQGLRQEGAAREPAAPALPAMIAGAVIALSPSAMEGGEAPSLLGLAELDLGALAQLVAAELEGLDSVSPDTDSRTLLQLLGASDFSVTADQGNGNTLSVWGRGSYTSLEGAPDNRYDYEGDSYAFYLGMDRRFGDYLAGLAVGYAISDLELRNVSDTAAPRSDFESGLVAVYPYAAWQPSERMSVWLLAGYGAGELEIEERDTTTRKASSDTALLLGAAGLSWRRPAGDVDMVLRFSGTALHSETDGGRFDNDVAYEKTETDAQQLRSEVELGRVFGLEGGGRMRPYLSAGMSYDFGDGSRDAVLGEFGTGVKLHWPRLGLETELEFQARLASRGERDHREYTGTGTLRYDLGGDRRGLQLALRPQFTQAPGRGLGAWGAASTPLDGGAFGGGSSSLSAGRRGGGLEGLGLRGELSYGIGDVRLARGGLPGLLTLYGTSGLSSEASRYGGGVRFEAARFTLDAGLRRESGGTISDSEFLLDSAFRF